MLYVYYAAGVLGFILCWVFLTSFRNIGPTEVGKKREKPSTRQNPKYLPPNKHITFF